MSHEETEFLKIQGKLPWNKSGQGFYFENSFHCFEIGIW